MFMLVLLVFIGYRLIKSLISLVIIPLYSEIDVIKFLAYLIILGVSIYATLSLGVIILNKSIVTDVSLIITLMVMLIESIVAPRLIQRWRAKVKH